MNTKKNQHDDFSAPSSGAFDLEIGPYRGEFDQAFLKKSNARGFARGGGMIAFGIDPDISRLIDQEHRLIVLNKRHH